jgi:hypothetical protein
MSHPPCNGKALCLQLPLNKTRQQEPHGDNLRVRAISDAASEKKKARYDRLLTDLAYVKCSLHLSINHQFNILVLSCFEQRSTGYS